MNHLKKYFLIALVLFLSNSCSFDTHMIINKETIEDDHWYETKLMSSGCCGCYAYYFNIFQGKQVKEQFVVELGCGLFGPTKHLFKTQSEKEVPTVAESYLAVTDNSFEIPLTKLEREIFEELDSAYRAWSGYTERKAYDFTAITGYKMAGESPVHFPLMDGLKKPTPPESKNPK